jgi:uncharacterized protein YfaP (DUF2135 family)
MSSDETSGVKFQEQEIPAQIQTTSAGNQTSKVEIPAPWRSWRDGVERDHLYVVESSCGAIKIGRSQNVTSRIKGLLTQCPPSVSLTVLAPGLAHEVTHWWLPASNLARR